MPKDVSKIVGFGENSVTILPPLTDIYGNSINGPLSPEEREARKEISNYWAGKGMSLEFAERHYGLNRGITVTPSEEQLRAVRGPFPKRNTPENSPSKDDLSSSNEYDTIYKEVFVN